MTATQYFCLIGIIYLAPNMTPAVRTIFSILFMGLAIYARFFHQ